jgi:hypothetical protein
LQAVRQQLLRRYKILRPLRQAADRLSLTGVSL